MSRRKQSNPKPLKREDEEDSPVQDTVDKLSDSVSPKAKSNAERSPPSLPPNSPHSNSGGESPTPKLRLNTSLATDPALRSETMTVKTEIASPNSESNPVRGPSAAELEYLASLSPAFRALATAGHLFPPAPIPESDAINLPKNRSKQEPPTVLIENRTVPVFMCTPCGIRFSSASTLEAHQTYYCSHRVQAKGRDSDGDDPKSPQGGTEDETPSKVSRTGKQYACPHCSYSADKKVSLNRHMRMHSSSPAAPLSLPVPVILPSSMHNGVEQQQSSPDSSQLVDRYCQDCDIRFSSVKTLKAHKLHYCSSRHAKGSPTSKNSSTPTSPAESQRLSPEPPRNSKSNGQPFLLLRTNPILIVPYSLLQSASVFTGGASNLPSQDTACILLPNGTVQPMSNLVPHLANDKDLPRNPHLSEQVLKMREESPPTKNTRKSEITPLDLSVRRPSESSDLVIDMEDEKENVFTSSPHHEDIVCAPSIPSMLGRSITPEKRSPEGRKSESYSSTPSPNLPPSPNPKKSPRRTPNGITNIKMDGRSKDGNKKLSDLEYQNQINFFIAEQSSRRNSVGGKNNPISLLPSPLPILLPGAPELLNQTSLFPLLNPELRIPGLVGGQAVTESPVGQVLIKQGVSKCQECNIVFCKHENYIAHKKHYCSARLPDLSSDESSRNSPGASKSPALVGSNKESSVENSKTSQNQNPPPGKSQTLPYHQLFCVACGISFTSLDNLTTHQTYYCTKRSTEGNKPTDEKTRRCSKCKVIAGPDHQCVTAPSNPTVTGWKCPCCDTVSPTAAAAQKHMDTHQSVKAFRCTICKYKGNTLRGMRTHIRMHFDKKNNDLQEEQYIQCIIDPNTMDKDAEQLAPPPVEQPPPPPPLIQPPHNNGVADSPRPSQVVVKVEVGTDEEFVDVDVIEPQSRVKDEGVNQDEDDEKSLSANNNVKKLNYCKSCDITFTYHSSLIAHKKFYCSAQSSENDCQSKSPRTTPETSVQ